jgi:dihydroorotate dehydrogenase
MSKFDLLFLTSIMNAAGSLGFIPPKNHPDLPRLGAFITNPISLKPRKHTRRPVAIPFSGGFLLHTGHPNPGFKNALRLYSEHWKRLDIPVITHLLFDRTEDLGLMVGYLESSGTVMAIELGLPPNAGPEFLQTFARSVSSELPMILQIPIDRTISLFESLAEPLIKEKFAAFSLGPPRGMLPDGPDRLVHGRLYGPALFPQALSALQILLPLDVPVIGGSAYSLKQAEIMVATGAVAVQVDTALWRGALPEG